MSFQGQMSTQHCTWRGSDVDSDLTSATAGRVLLGESPCPLPSSPLLQEMGREVAECQNPALLGLGHWLASAARGSFGGSRQSKSVPRSTWPSRSSSHLSFCGVASATGRKTFPTWPFMIKVVSAVLACAGGPPTCAHLQAVPRDCQRPGPPQPGAPTLQGFSGADPVDPGPSQPLQSPARPACAARPWRTHTRLGGGGRRRSSPPAEAVGLGRQRSAGGAAEVRGARS